MIKRETIESILERAQIEDVVGRYVNLRRKGANLWGLCPFHDEKTPSFSVSPQKGIFKCFGCGKAGDSITFVKEVEHLDYVGAVRKLGEMYGIKVEERKLTDEEQRVQNDRESMTVLNEYAMQWFEEQLWNSDEGRAKGLSDMVGRRGIDEKTLRDFNAGYCPAAESALTDAAIQAGYQRDFLLMTGLSVKDPDTGRLLDYLSGRVVLPIQNRAGKVIAFIGLSADGGSDIVTPENELFRASSALYGIFQAARAIGKTGTAHIVADAADILALHQAGVENVVATGSDLLTARQVLNLGKFTRTATLTPADADTARLNINLLLKAGLKVNIIPLPESACAAQFAGRSDSESVQKHYAERQVNCIDYLSGLLLKNAGGDVGKKISAIRTAAETIACIPDSMTSEMYAKKFAQQLGYDYSAFITEIETAKQTHPKAFDAADSVIKYAEMQASRPHSDKSQEADDGKSTAEQMLRLNRFAQQWFENQLWNTDMGKSVGLSYIMGKRGMSEQTVREYHIGYCPNAWSAMTDAALKAGFSKDMLIATGLSIKGDKDRLYDRFRGRIIFPTHDVNGNVVAFGGRIMFEDKEKKFAKYVNSSDSEVYHKNEQLYGIYQAKSAIKARDCVYLVEGYLDVMSSHQVGIGNVLASSGTSLTENQIALIGTLTRNVYVLYDGDAAGIHATERGIGMLLSAGMNVKALCLPENDDPDSFAKKHDAQYVVKYFDEQPVDGIEYLVDILLAGAGNDIDKRVEAIKTIAATIGCIAVEQRRIKVAEEYAAKLEIDPANFVAEVERQRIQNSTGPKPLIPPKPPTPNADTAKNKLNSHDIAEIQNSENMLTKCLLRNGNVVLYTDKSGQDITCGEYLLAGLQTWKVDFITIVYKKIVDEYRQYHEVEGFSIADFFGNHHDEDVSTTVKQLLVQREKPSRIFGKISISENTVVQTGNEKKEVEPRGLPTYLKEYLLRRVAYDRKQWQQQIKALYDKQSELTTYLKNTEIMEDEEEQNIRRQIDELSKRIKQLWQWDDLLRQKEIDIKQSLNWVI